MEIRASYLLVGSAILVLVGAFAAFTVWLVKIDVDRAVTLYEIAFEGSVTGLQEGGQVRYRGVPVGRVADIRLDPDNIEAVQVRVEIEQGTPIKQDTVATLEMQGITGIAFVQLRGGTQDSPALEPPPGDELPRIASRRSAIERVFESTPELLARGVTVLERLSDLVAEDNVAALTRTLANLETFTDALAAEADRIGPLMDETTTAAAQIEDVSTELIGLSTDLRQLTTTLEARVGGVGDELNLTLGELQTAASALAGAAQQLDGVLDTLSEPLDDFAGSGLYEFTQLVGETRLLIAALTRITKEIERDPAGFLIGGQRGFEAE